MSLLTKTIGLITAVFGAKPQATRNTSHTKEGSSRLTAEQQRKIMATQGSSWWVEENGKRVASKGFTPGQTKPVASKAAQMLEDEEVATVLLAGIALGMEAQKEKAAKAAAKKAPQAKRVTITPAKTPVAQAQPLTGADKTAQRVKDKFPNAMRGSVEIVARQYSEHNRQQNLHPFAVGVNNLKRK